MLNPNYQMLARILHEERVAEALQAYQRRAQREPQANLFTRLLLMLGNRLIDLGQKFKTQAVAPQLPQELSKA